MRTKTKIDLIMIPMKKESVKGPEFRAPFNDSNQVKAS